MNHRGATRNDRRRYNRVEQQVTAEEEEEEAAAAADATQLLASNNNNRRPPARRNNNNNNRRQQYDRIASVSDDDEEQEEASTTLDAAAEDATATSTAASVSTDTDTFVIDDDEEEEEEEELKMSITILDFAQSRFEVKANPDWTVGRFKQAGAAVHKVAPARQRLIYRGKMLQDDTKSLQQVGLATSGIIVHLFPKPRVVITNSSSANNSQADACDAADDDDDDNSVMDEEQGGGGARVPTIVMDAEEAERRSQILVLGSTDFIEAQNNVKLFSFMLLIISSIELLNLFSIAMGVPQQDNSSSSMGMPMDDYSAGGTPPTDDFFTGSNNNYTTSMNQHYGAGGSDADAQRAAAAELITHWGPAQYVDTVVSLLGVYVALLGLKASTENTLRLARVYLIGLFGCGTLWLLYNFFFTAAIEHKIEEHKQEEHHAHNSTDDYHDYSPPLTDADIYNQAFQVMMLPALVWIMCCLRAWQFQHLLYEAEAEATDRIQAQLRLAEQDDEEEDNNNNDAPDDDDEDGRNNDNNNNNTTEQQQPNAGDVVDHDEELALGSRTAVLT